ncbi:MAG: MopE-related protein [Myxococcales bacterium]
MLGEPLDLAARRPSSPGERASQSASSAQAPVDVGAVMRRVRHGFREDVAAGGSGPRPSKGASERFKGGADIYRVQVDKGAVTLTPVHYPNGRPVGAARREPRLLDPVQNPASSGEERLAGSPLTLETSAITRGGKSLLAAPMTEVGSEGELRIKRGAVTEVLRNSEQDLEQSWELSKPPAGEGDLLVRVAVRGQKLRAADHTGLHFVGSQHELGFAYSHATVVDASGERTPVPVRFEDGAIVLAVNAELLDEAEYPLVIDPVVGPERDTGIPVFGPASLDEGDPVVAASGQGTYLVVWEVNQDLYGTRVNASGSVLDPAGIAISTAMNAQVAPAVAHDGTNWLVVWSDFRSGAANILGTRVRTTTGAVLDPNGFTISNAVDAQSTPAVAHNGSNWLVVWADARNATGSSDVYGARVTSNGVILDANGIAMSTAANVQSAPSVASGGANWLVAWNDYRSDVNHPDVYAARIDANGVLVDSSGIAIATGAGDERNPAVAYDGTQWLIAMERATDLYGARLSAAGVVLDPSGFVVSTAVNSQSDPAVSYDGSNWVVVWSDARSGVPSVYGARVNAGATVLDASGFPIATAAQSRYPAIARDGTSCLVVWEDDRSTAATTIYGARVSSGSILDASGIALSSSAANQQSSVALAYDGTNWLVVWRDDDVDSSDIYGTRVNAAGVVLDPNGIGIATGPFSQFNPAVAHNGTDWLVVWEDSSDSPSLYDLYGTRVTANGTVLNPTPIAISTAAQNQLSPAIASDGYNWFVVWHDNRSGNYDTYGTRVDASGFVLNPSGLALSTATNNQLYPAASYDGTNWLVVWQDYRNGSGNSDIYGTRVSSSGVLLNPSGISIATGAQSQLFPALAHDGTNWLVAWDDFRGATYDIYGARVNAGGGLLDTSGLVLGSGAGDQTSASVAHDGTSWIVAWQDKRSGGSIDIYGSRVDANGVRLDANGFGIATGSPNEQAPAIASGPNGTLLVSYASVSGANVRAKIRLFRGQCAAADVTCDGVDDDCNGTADEDYVPTPGSCGVGACLAMATKSCSAGVEHVVCTPGTPASSDATCNGIDEDCNGTKDEDYVPSATACGIGACSANGTKSCVAGSEHDSCTPGTPAPSDATCNGLDDDCNGTSDEDYLLTATACGVGVCSASGTLSCTAGSEHNSCTPGTPASSDATCNGLDDDCNGTSDEDYVPVATTCGMGVCSASGSMRCITGQESNNCVPGAPTGNDASCNGLDDDCDGHSDEAFVAVQGCGVCVSGTCTTLPSGASCTTGLQCTSGFCKNSVCAAASAVPASNLFGLSLLAVGLAAVGAAGMRKRRRSER